jgi:hypothetical protein
LLNISSTEPDELRFGLVAMSVAVAPSADERRRHAAAVGENDF